MPKHDLHVHQPALWLLLWVAHSLRVLVVVTTPPPHRAPRGQCRQQQTGTGAMPILMLGCVLHATRCAAGGSAHHWQW